MKQEDLRSARLIEAKRRWIENETPRREVEHLADLYETNWPHPKPEVDADLLAFNAWAGTVSVHRLDREVSLLAYLAGCTRGREEAKGLVEAPFRLNDRVKHKGQFGDAIGSIMAMQRFDHGWECWVHVAAYGYNSIIQADNLRLVSHAPDALAAAKGERV
jgi:hypothetical protein